MFFPSEFCFLGPAFFYATFIQFVFIEIPSHFLLGTKRFASIEDSLRSSALCDLPETFIEKFLRNKVSRFFCQRLSVQQEDFPSFNGNL